MTDASASFDQILPQAGTLLVAHPRMLDPNFMHAVVLLCDHGDEGTYGLVVNRRTEKRVLDLGSKLPLLDGRRDPLWLGGPVSTGTLQILHRCALPVDGAHEILPGTFVGGDPDHIQAGLDAADGDLPLRFVLGYSGWGSGQLQSEMAEGAWILCPATADVVFDDHPSTLWRRVLRARGRPYAALADMPPDPTWN